MPQLNLETVKSHLVIDADVVDDDDLLLDNIAAAEMHIQNATRRDLNAEFPDGWPAPLTQAAKMLVAHFYTNREASVVGIKLDELPLGVSALIAPYRSFSAE